MNPDQSTPQESSLTLEQSVAQVLQTLPPPIRTYLQSGQHSLVAQDLMNRYRLHADQAAILEREVMLLIMGLEEPQEFEDALVHEASIPIEMVAQINEELNKSIFIPLRDQMRKAPAPAPVSRPTIPPPKYVPVVPASPPPAPVQPAPSLQPQTSPPVAVPHFSGPRPAITIPVPPQPSAPQALQQIRAVPPPPPNLPGAMPPVTPQPQLSARPPAVRTPVPPPPPRVPGTPDPYREPVE